MTAKTKLLKYGLLAGAVVAANAWVHHEGYSIPGRTLVRCSSGHEFTTLWVSGASLTSLRLGLHTRLMRCPECRTLRLVHPVKLADQPVAA